MRKQWLSISLTILGCLILLSCTDQEKSTPDVFITTTVTNEGYNPAINVDVDLPAISKIQFSAYTKNPSAAVSDLQVITIYRMKVDWVRIDGGTAIPDPFETSLWHQLDVGGTTDIANIPLMDPDQTQLPPFDQLFPWNGGIDAETQKAFIECDADITFYARTANGEDLTTKHVLSFYFYYSAV